MILVLILGYVLVLHLVIKFEIVKPTPFWKISPLIWGFIVYIILAILMPEVKPVAKANSFDEEEIIIKDAA